MADNEQQQSGDQGSDGDYGYDMAHEVKSYLATPPHGHRMITPTTAGRHPESDPNADYGYDEAHEF